MLTHVRRLSWKEEFLLLTQVLVQLGISPEIAAADACKVEHNLSEEPFEKIKAHTAGGNCPLKPI